MTLRRHLLFCAATLGLSTNLGCSFRSPDTNQPLGCVCDARPNAYAYCDYAACKYGGCKRGYFDLDGQPSNGCETDADHLPGNLHANISDNNGYVSWQVDTVPTYLAITGGTIAATMAQPGCIASQDHPCAYRLEAFDLWIGDLDLPQPGGDTVVFSDGVFSSGPIEGTDNGVGIEVSDANVMVAFTVLGMRRPMQASASTLLFEASPDLDGTAVLYIAGSVKGPVYDSDVTLTFDIATRTNVVFPPRSIVVRDAGIDSARDDAADNAGSDGANNIANDTGGDERGPSSD